MIVPTIIQPDAVKEQLDRIIKSTSFKNSEVLTNFLKYVVNETLEGRERFIKEYVIATEVLKKNSDFDPQLDAIVRIHAMRLRKALENYYNQEGKKDHVSIAIPKGTYIPDFDQRQIVLDSDVSEINSEQHIDIKNDKKPVIVILPFQNYTQNANCEVMSSVLCHELRDELTRYHELSIISDHSSYAAIEKIGEKKYAAKDLGADYMFTGGCFGDDELIKFSVELIAIEERQQIWSETFHLSSFEKSVIRSFEMIIMKITSVVAGHFGLIYRDYFERHHENIVDDSSYLYAIYWINQYQRNFSYKAFQEALKYLKVALTKNPNHALLLALMGENTLNLRMVDYINRDKIIESAMIYINRANKIDPNNQFVYKQFAWAALLKGNKREFIKAAEKCIAINPNNMTMRGIMGFGYICAGEHEKGLEMQLDATQLNPYYPWYFAVGFCFYYLIKHEWDEALYWAYRANRPEFHWDPLLRSSIYGLMNQADKAKTAVKELKMLVPNIDENAPMLIDAFILDDSLKQLLISGLVKVGINT